MTTWPEKLFDGAHREFNLETWHFNFEKQRDRPDAWKHNAPGQEWILGYALPPFQRPLIWDRERMTRFVESAALGIHLGIYVFNTADDVDPATGHYHHTNRWLVDGQQRLTAVHEFFGYPDSIVG